MTTTKTLKRYQVRNLADAIRQLDGRLVVEDLGEKKVAIVKPFDLTTKVRYAAAKTLSNLESEMEAIEKTQKDHLRTLPAEPSKQERDKCDEDLRQFMVEAVSVAIHTVPIAQLNVEKNALPPQLVSHLMPMLEDDA